MPASPLSPADLAPLTAAEIAAIAEAAKWFQQGPLEIDPDDDMCIRVGLENESFPGSTFADFGFDDAARDTLLLGRAAPRLLATIEQQAKRIAELEVMGAKVNAIRSDIVGRQGINWSRHIYPLVAALNEAGFVSDDYDEARAKAMTSDQRIAELEAGLREAVKDGCALVYGGRPPGWTCIDNQKNARADLARIASGEARVPGEMYSTEYGLRLASGADLCLPCRLRALLSPAAPKEG